MRGHCYCKASLQARLTQCIHYEFMVNITYSCDMSKQILCSKAVSPASNDLIPFTPPSQSETWGVCVFSVVTARVPRRSAHIPSIPPSPWGRPHLFQSPTSVRESNRCRLLKTCRQLVGESTAQWHPCHTNILSRRSTYNRYE